MSSTERRRCSERKKRAEATLMAVTPIKIKIVGLDRLTDALRCLNAREVESIVVEPPKLLPKAPHQTGHLR